MTTAEILTIIALVCSPLLAVQVTIFLEKRKQIEERRFAIFRILMATRAQVTSPEHVQALNSIDIEFFGKGQREKKVQDAWKIYLDHLGTPMYDQNAWGEKRVELLTDLLYDMSQYFNYGFDRVYLKKNFYIPGAHTELVNDQYAIRKAVVDWVSGKTPLPIKITNDLATDKLENNSKG